MERLFWSPSYGRVVSLFSFLIMLTCFFFFYAFKCIRVHVFRFHFIYLWYELLYNHFYVFHLVFTIIQIIRNDIIPKKRISFVQFKSKSNIIPIFEPIFLWLVMFTSSMFLLSRYIIISNRFCSIFIISSGWYLLFQY